MGERGGEGKGGTEGMRACLAFCLNWHVMWWALYFNDCHRRTVLGSLLYVRLPV